MIHGFDLKGSSGVPGYIPEEARLLEYESRRPYHFKTISQARGFELGKLLLNKQPSWSGAVSINSAECSWHLMMHAPEEIAINEDMKNSYDVVIKAMKCVPEFFNTKAVEFKKMKGRHGMRVLELNVNR